MTRLCFEGVEYINTELYSYVLAASFVAVILLSPLLSGMADFAGKKNSSENLLLHGIGRLHWSLLVRPKPLEELSMIPFSF